MLGLARERAVIVPGNHDINRVSCQAYFLDCASNEETPVAPYWRKWEHFHRMFRAFYGDSASIQFTPDEPWTWYEYKDLVLVVAGLNSTIAESHRDEDHHGYVGEKQLRWFADRLRAYEGMGWFRLGVMHHNYQRGVPSDDESLRMPTTSVATSVGFSTCCCTAIPRGQGDWLKAPCPSSRPVAPGYLRGTARGGREPISTVAATPGPHRALHAPLRPARSAGSGTTAARQTATGGKP